MLTPGERRLRAGWRLLGQLVLMGFLLALFSIVGITILRPFQDVLALSAVLGFLAISASVFLARRLLDRRSIRSLGLQWNSKAAADLVFGIILTGAQMGLIYLLFWGVGWLEFEGYAWEFMPSRIVLGGILATFVVFILVGWQEELLSRGYWLQNLREGLNLFWAVVISSGMFAIAHLGNPNIGWMGIAGLLAAGFFLAYGYVCTGQLWLPIGLHIGWNFFEGTVFGFPVSGLDTFKILYHTVHGPEIITGGLFGPEAGLIILPVLLLGAVGIARYASWRDSNL